MPLICSTSTQTTATVDPQSEENDISVDTQDPIWTVVQLYSTASDKSFTVTVVDS